MTNVRTPSNKTIAKKWNLSPKKVASLVKRGAEHEQEHDTDLTKASETARDHIGERPDYYKMLDKAEKMDKNKINEDGYQLWPGKKKKKFFNGPKDENGKTETQKWAEKRQKEREAKKENLDEISKEKLGRYINNAAADWAERERDYGKDVGENPDHISHGKDDRKRWNREAGIAKAVKRLTKEETQLDEISLKKKIKYAVKAAGQQTRIAKELRPDEVESDKTFRKRKKGLDRVFKEESQIDEISAELVGKVSNARFRQGKAPSKTLSRAINKKFIESGNKKETKMDTKEKINEALDNILENNLVDMKENFLAILQEKAIERLEEKKKDIAENYFGQ